MGTIIFWVVIAIGVYIYLRRKNKIPKLIKVGWADPSKRRHNIDENSIVQEWSQLLLGMGGKGEELLKSIAQKIQEMKLSGVTLSRKEATLGRSNATLGDRRHEFVSAMLDRYPDYEFWVGAIDRTGQLKVSWYLTVELPGRITGTLKAMNKASRETLPLPRALNTLRLLPRTHGKMMAQKINEKLAGKPVPIRVAPDEMTLDDKEEFGSFMTVMHQAVLDSVEEMMNSLNLDFSKVDKHTEGFINLS